MSVETITIVISAVGLLLGFVGGFAWMISRMDAGFEKQALDLGSRISAVERELGEVKVAVARLEGPRRTFLTAP